MTWDQDHAVESPAPGGVEVTPMVRRRSQVGEQQFVESITVGTTQLDSELTLKLWFHHLDTLTHEETKQEFETFLHTLKTTQMPVLTRCLMIVAGLPEPVVPTVLDQLQEIAQYETRLWHHRIERSDRASIGEDIRVLPVGRE